MTIDHVRHGRQIRLPEIGEAGQERLVAAAVALPGQGDAHEIAASYLARSGVRVVDQVGAAAGPGAERDAKACADALASLGVRDSAARDVAEGALQALVAMRNILGVDGAGSAT